MKLTQDLIRSFFLRTSLQDDYIFYKVYPSNALFFNAKNILSILALK